MSTKSVFDEWSQADDLTQKFRQSVASLHNSSGVAYREFRKSLSPRYGVVWAELLCGHGVLIGTVMVLLFQKPLPWWVALLVIACSALLIGGAIAYLALFMHEAAHFNLAQSTLWNDRLANLLIGVLTGTEIKTYRPTHFDHHRKLGLPDDPEHFYFNPLNWHLVIASLTGMTLLQAVRKRFHNTKVTTGSAPAASGKPSRSNSFPWVLVGGMLLHGGLVVGSLWFHCWFLTFSWLAGVLLVWPFFTVLRPILEHRSTQAMAGTDYFRVPHGAVNRLFGDGPLAWILGGAGFNRHLLHHLEPQISYTRLRELEQFLQETSLEPLLKPHRTTYLRVFGELFGK
ncbi:MAG: fatty acid desaturase [Blastocatellia bacterium]|nr:fatty acid desaturase [Blastocatellia bacterium]